MNERMKDRGEYIVCPGLKIVSRKNNFVVKKKLVVNMFGFKNFDIVKDFWSYLLFDVF